MKNYLTYNEQKKFILPHISNSAIRSFITNEYKFFKNYIEKIWDDEGSPSMVEGKLVHKAIELIEQTIVNGSEPNIEAIKSILERKFNEQVIDINFGKTGSPEKSLSTIMQCIDFYMAEHPKDKVVGLEEMIVDKVRDLDGNTLPIKLKGVVDMIARDEKGLYIKDHKIVSSFSDEADYDYILQATMYYLLVLKKYKEAPYKVVFQEIKKSKNRDGGPQINLIEVKVGQMEIFQFQEIYKRFVRRIAGRGTFNIRTGENNLLPNFYEMFGPKMDLTGFFMNEKINFKKVIEKQIIKEPEIYI